MWGLTFKAGTDDLRNSPAVEVVQRLVEEGAIVQAFDPTVEVPMDEQSAPVDGLAELSSTGAGRASPAWSGPSPTPMPPARTPWPPWS